VGAEAGGDLVGGGGDTVARLVAAVLARLAGRRVRA
jgi:hypothetical protein